MLKRKLCVICAYRGTTELVSENETWTGYKRSRYESANTLQDTHVDDIKSALEKVILDPKYHDILTLVKGVRNGIVYGAKVRFPHALVYVFTCLIWSSKC